MEWKFKSRVHIYFIKILSMEPIFSSSVNQHIYSLPTCAYDKEHQEDCMSSTAITAC